MKNVEIMVYGKRGWEWVGDNADYKNEREIILTACTLAQCSDEFDNCEYRYRVNNGEWIDLGEICSLDIDEEDVAAELLEIQGGAQ